MCALCASSGKVSGGFGCTDAASTNGGAGGEKTNAPQVNGDGTTAESSGADTVAGSTSTSSTLSAGSSFRGFVNSSTDQDWYRVDLVAGHQYTFELNGFGKGAIADTFLHLYNASGTEIASDDDSGPINGSLLTFTASTTASYYIAAAGYGSGTGQYLLTMNNGSTPYTPVVTVQDAADYLTNTYWEVNGTQARHFASNTVTFNADGLEPERATLARQAFQLWSDVCGLTFVETHGAANITLDDAQSGAYSSSSVTGGGLITASVINVDSNWYGGIDAFDSYTLQTFIHEIGHAIGLGHAGAYNGSAVYGTDNIYANDTWQMSIMSYMAQNNYGGDTYRFDMTPMMADIMAVQSMYGASTARSTDTVYGFGSTAGFAYDFSFYSSAPAFTIYDSGGIDTLNASGYSQAQLIDLRPGSFSNVGGLVGNVGIYLTAVIEKAVGGSGNDTIIGNDANNTLKGGAGNDTIDGGAGTDSAVFSGARSAYTITGIGGTSVRVAGPDGTDTLTNVELLVFDDQTVSWTPANLPDLAASNLHLGSSSVVPGGSTTVSYTVSNIGLLAANASTVGVYLSADSAFDGGDTLLATRSVSALSPGASFNDSFSLTLSAAGSYYLIAVADYNSAINEGNEGNNASNGAQINVIAPLSVVGGGGNDTLSGGLGNDTIDGGPGDDTAVFAQGIGSYNLHDLGSRITVSGPEGNDTLYNIEHLRFADGTVNVNDGNPLFDTLFYDRANLDVFGAGVNALAHFNNSGWHEGRDPNEFFDTSFYLSVNADVRKSGVNPLDQYHQTGWREGRDPSPNFDTKLYLLHNPDVAAAGIDPLAHYLASGQAEGRQAYAAIGTAVKGFDAEYYLQHNPDVAAAGIDPFQHYSTSGWHEGRNPNAYFDTAGYLAHNPDVAAAGINPLTHYETSGWLEGRAASANFNTRGYLAANPDVAAAGLNPLDHFLNNGIYEGRPAVSDALWH